MLKKASITQLILLIGTMILGTILVGTYSQSVKVIHAGLGLVTGLNSLIITYLAFKQKAQMSLLIAACITVGFTFLAGVGGKLGEVNYASGLLLMRASSVVAFISAAFILYRITRKKG